ncbi:GBS Bsp-like repeat-containing protein, partial [Erysipelatoclostridium ramosum]
MTKKLSKKALASIVAAGIAYPNGIIVNAINGINDDNNQVVEIDEENKNISSEDDSTFTKVELEKDEATVEDNATEANSSEVAKSKINDENRQVIGQASFVDENGNITNVDVYDGTAGENYNPNARVVSTANMVNFNCSAAGPTTKYIDYYTGQEGYLSKSSAADAAFLGYENNKVKFMISGVVGLVDANLVQVLNQGTYYASNYEVNSKGKLYHYISTNVNASGNQGTYNFVGDAPSYLTKGVEYYSYDGHYFYTDYSVMIADYKNNIRVNSVNKNNPYYNYFQYLPLRSKTNYTSAQLTTYMNNKTNSSISKLNNTGDIFVKYQNQYGVNALLAMSFAALESGWGKSDIAQNNNNLFGLNATDENPAGNADTYPTVDNCVYDFTANWMSKKYLNATYISRFRGGYFGDKGSGIFGQYSSDPYEGEKCASIAANMDSGISSKDKNYYTIGIKDVSVTSYTSLNVRSGNSINTNVLYTTIKNPAYAFIVRKKDAINNFYEIQSDSVINSTRTGVATSANYDFDDNYAYVSSNYITIINEGNEINSQKVPEITNVKTTNITRNGYTVTCTVKSESKLTKVQMPTWTNKNWQDDLKWYDAKITDNGNGIYTVSCDIKTSNHNNESGQYITHIYATNASGKQGVANINDIEVPVNQPPVISNIKVTNIDSTGYTVTCTVTDDVSVKEVKMPTWSEKNWQDDLVWHQATKNGNEYSYRVKTSDHKGDSGKYQTHIYAYDADGGVTVVDQSITVPEAEVPEITNVKTTNITRNGYTVTCTVKS